VAVIIQGDPPFGGGKNASLIETPRGSQAVDSEVVNKEVYLLFPSQKAETALQEKKN
jgi:hypothetical protein